jgi:hypothetical protein
MKKFFTIILCIIAIGCSSSSVEGLKSLGSDEFEKEKWAAASQEARGKMVYSFIKRYDIHKMDAKDIKNLLGPSTAYYNYDEFPAYLVGPKAIKTEYGDGYLFAFPTDRKTGKIKKYIILPKIR